MKAIITVGVSASGKSTFAEEWLSDEQNRVEVNRDSVRRRLMEDDGKEFSWAKWNWKREKEVTTLCDAKLEASVKSGMDIIVSDTNLNGARREQLVLKLQSYGYEVEIKDFYVTWEEAVKRDNARLNGVGQSVLATQFEHWNTYIGRKTYTPDVTKPKCILVDIDGTLAHMNGKRGAFEWHKVGLDDVDDSVRMMCYMTKFAYQQGHFVDLKVIILSGRDGVCRPETEDWLVRHGVVYDTLIMRAPNDMRKDTVVKEEIFWRDIADNYNVEFVIDDRPCVVRLWQEIGLKTFAVGNQHIEF